jgi:hypothetical protein
VDGGTMSLPLDELAVDSKGDTDEGYYALKMHFG